MQAHRANFRVETGHYGAQRDAEKLPHAPAGLKELNRKTAISFPLHETHVSAPSSEMNSDKPVEERAPQIINETRDFGNLQRLKLFK
jgi:hypothetical protein